jgi:hypothetical protein
VSLPTHLAFASVLYNLGGAIPFGYRPDPIGWALAAVASLLPDVDRVAVRGEVIVQFWLCRPDRQPRHRGGLRRWLRRRRARALLGALGHVLEARRQIVG